MDSIEQTLATVHALLRAESLEEAAAIVRTYPAREEQVGYDNWNGGADIIEVQFELPAEVFVRLGARKTQLEEQISARLKTVIQQESHDVYSARFVPAMVSVS